MSRAVREDNPVSLSFLWYDVRVRFPGGWHESIKNMDMETKDVNEMTLEELRKAYKDLLSVKEMWCQRAQKYERQVESLKVVLKMFVA